MKPVLHVRNLSCLLLAMTMTAPSLSAFAQEAPRRAGLDFTFPAATGGTAVTGTSPTDEDATGEPTIKLPPIPPRRVTPTNPTTPTPPRTSGNTMSGIDKSAFPGMSCPLVDNRPHKDLLAATQALSRVVVVTPECQNNADMVKISEEAKKLVAAGTNLQGLWQNPEALTTDAKSLASFNGDVNVMISGLNNLTTQLQQNSLLNSKCGKEMMTGTGVIVAVSDLISSFAPFALIGASMNPAMGAALPYILGFTGVGSVAKIIKNMADANTLNMDKIEHRQAVLQNVCEFSKISQRVRFLKLAQSGQLEQVTSEIQGMRRATYSLLRSQYSDRVSSIATIRQNLDQTLRNADATLRKDQSELQSVTTQLTGQTDKHLLCYAAREIVERAGSPAVFPTRAVMNLQSLLGQQNQPTLAQTTMLKSEERLRLRLRAGANDESDKGIEECASIGKAYIDALARLLLGTRDTILKQSSSLERQLSRDSEYSLFRRTELAAQREVDGLQKVANILQQLNMDNAIIDKMELDTQMSGLKRALFGTPAGLPIIRGVSPAEAWLDFVGEQNRRAFHQFNTEMTSLVNDAYRVTQSGRMDFFQRDAQGNVSRDRFGHPIRLSSVNQNQIIIDNLRAASELKNLTADIAPAGSDNQKVLCQRLENIWLSWAATMDHLAAQDFFCQNIRGFFDSNTSSGLINKCVGRRDLNGRVLVMSQIAASQAELGSNGAREKALLISSKMKELNCEMPDAGSIQ